MDPKNDREHEILERILSLKQILAERRGGPLELHELGICFFHLNNFLRAEEHLTHLLEQYPDYVERAAVYSLKIYALIQEKRLGEAEVLIRERLKVNEIDTTLLSFLAHIQEAMGKFREAIRSHLRILEIDPESTNSMNSAGYLITLHGDPEEQSEAYRLLTGALKKKPDYPAYLDSLGVYLSRKGEKEHARKALMKALKRAPRNTIILDHLKGVLEV
jgi:tetratricopeptide (TPR) repeat protein